MIIAQSAIINIIITIINIIITIIINIIPSRPRRNIIEIYTVGLWVIELILNDTGYSTGPTHMFINLIHQLIHDIIFIN